MPVTSRNGENGGNGRERSVFEVLGVAPVINCCGIYTDLGGSILAPGVWKAAEELNTCFVRMPDLLDAAGRIIARLTGAEAARVTPGASAALALSVGAAMVGGDTARWEQLPDTTGLRNEALMSAYHARRYKYAPCARASGAKIAVSGPVDHYDLHALMDGIGPKTACVLVPGHLLDGFSGTAELTRLCAAVHSKNVLVVVDAAYLSYPTHLLGDLSKSGADLTCVSAKYFYGPNPGGFVMGCRDLIDIVEGLDFTRYESGKYRTFGRPYKMSRYDVATTALALQEWMAMDHRARWDSYAARVRTIAAAVPPVPGMTVMERYFTMDEVLTEADRVNCLALKFDASCKFTARGVADAMEAEWPAVVAIPEGDTLIVAVDAMIDGHETIAAQRIAQVLSR